MSRIANAPINVPTGVDVKVDQSNVVVKGKGGEMSFNLHEGVQIEIDGNIIKVKWDDAVKNSRAQAGTARACINNMVTGVSSGFEKKLTLIGVGYRAQVQGKKITLSLGFSNPVEYIAPEGITIEAPSQTELVVKGSDKQQVGQVAAEIRSFRPPEPYKGKGVRYADEYVARKEAKKK